MGTMNKITRDRDRDASEKVALGMASIGTSKGEVMYDQRLFNQEKAMDSGFARMIPTTSMTRGYLLLSPLFLLYTDQKKDSDSEMYGGANEQLEKIMKTQRFKPDKAISGTSERTGTRDGPVQFEQEVEEAHPFGLEEFLTQIKGKKAMSNVGSGGTMKARAGSTRDGYETSSRTQQRALNCLPVPVSLAFMCPSWLHTSTTLNLHAVVTYLCS